MRVDEAIYQELLGAIYDAALEPALWPEALVRVSDALSAVGALYLSYDPTRPEQARHVLARLDPELTRSYLIRYSRSSPWAKVRTSLPVGPAVSLDAWVPPATLMRSDFYHEILRPQRVLHCGSACLVRDARRYVGFSVFRSAQTGPTEGWELRLLSALAPHVKRATQISARHADAAALERAQKTALERIDHGVMIVDGHARVLYANRAAESVIARSDGMIVSARVLRGATTSDTQRLHALIADAVRGASGGTMRVARPSCAEPFLVLVAPTGSSGRWAVDSAPAAIVFITDPERRPRLELRRLMDLFGLTATEAKVALALADGRGVPDAARDLRLSPNTVHTHLRRIFSKLGVNRQSELVRVLARAAAIQPEIAYH